MNYLVIGTHAWNKAIFDTQIVSYLGAWYYTDDKQELELLADLLNPRYIFFLHWSWQVEKELTNRFECVCFHPSHLPYGRGGTPIQNLILRGFKDTELTAFKMTDEIDAGPIYGTRYLSLTGTAQDIFEREMALAADMVKEIAETQPVPVPQKGEVVVFKRRTPEQSRIEQVQTSHKLYDFIRMLDADDYPQAFLESGGFKYTFSQPVYTDDHIEAKVVITRK
jgi:methionyl-tRNA formyltransferase